MSTCDEIGSDVYALIKELANRRVDHRSETNFNKLQQLVEGTEVARLQRRFFFVLHEALSFRTRNHICRQGVALASTRQLPSQCPVSNHAHRTEGVTKSAEWKGANGVGGRIKVGSGNGYGYGVGGGNGDVKGRGDGDGAEVRTGVEANEGAQDGNGDGSGDGAGTGTVVETRRQSQDGNEDGSGDGDRDGRGDP